MQVVGGALRAFNLWNTCIVPSLLSNSGVWTNITKKQTKKLDDLQYEMVRSLLRLPSSTPLPALRGASGLMGMQWRIWQEKLLLVKVIREQYDKCLAKQVLEEQLTLELPGPVKEVSEICQVLGIPDVSREEVGKSEIKEAVHHHHQMSLKKEMEGLKKCEELKNQDLSKPQGYFSMKCLEDCRMAFRLQCKMFDCPGNMKSKYKGRMGCIVCTSWLAEGEVAPVATQEHLMVCPGLSYLWVGRDLEYSLSNKISYFRDVKSVLV